MADATATSCARALMSHHIAQFGVPTDISSDRGPQFTSNPWTALWKLLGAQLHRTTAYHPQANGIVERFHRQLKAALKAWLVGPDWMDELPLVLLGFPDQLPKRTSGAHPPSSSTAQQSACLGSFSKAHQQMSQMCQTCLHTFAPPWLDCGQSRHLIAENRPPTYLWSCRPVRLCLFVMTPIVPPFGAPMMDPSKCLNELQNTSL